MNVLEAIAEFTQKQRQCQLYGDPLTCEVSEINFVADNGCAPRSEFDRPANPTRLGIIRNLKGVIDPTFHATDRETRAVQANNRLNDVVNEKERIQAQSDPISEWTFYGSGNVGNEQLSGKFFNLNHGINSVFTNILS